MFKFFVTGTDTDIGKTYISARILRFFTNKNLSTIGMKPVACGCYTYKGMLISEDAELLMQESSEQLLYSQINPFAYEAPISPNIADIHKNLSSDLIYKKYNEVLTKSPDILVVEGAGGWAVPINDSETMADFVKQASLDVILVVGMRLGCLNHAILTIQNILSCNIKVKGWIANYIDPDMQSLDENIETLKKFMPVSFLGTIYNGQDIEEGSELANNLQELLAASDSL